MKATLISLSFDLRGHSLQVNVEMLVQENVLIQTLKYTDEELYATRDELGQEDWDFGTLCTMASKTLGGIDVLPPAEYLPPAPEPTEE